MDVNADANDSWNFTITMNQPVRPCMELKTLFWKVLQQ